MDAEIRKHYVQMALSLGAKVYQRDPERDTWFYYTDGTHIGYCQFPGHDSPSLSTVHVPNTTTGTGFIYTDRWEEITPEKMRAAMTCFAPQWASARDCETVKKWKDWDTFHRHDSYKREYRKVTA